MILENKDEEMIALEKKIKEGAVDKDIIDVLNSINSSQDYYTSSSCAGRLQLISLPKFGDKVNSVVLGKWHEPVDIEILKKALGEWDGNNFVMLLVQSPVVHVVCRDLQAASRLRNIADGSGFKYSTIRSIHTSHSDSGEQLNITVEILSTERMDIPIAGQGKIFPSDEYMDFMLTLAKQSIERSRSKLGRLKENLEKKL